MELFIKVPQLLNQHISIITGTLIKLDVECLEAQQMILKNKKLEK